ncbi:DNA-directed RNA polymerase III subunit RPC9 [Strongylocentrotus purpuratus]|uniref:DNA-directed RNA polymerase III subunit RPC9 n=1 Tax=Strongylocentrotus purpuratus TaxID=7668 RepID=A0A7M7PBT7_STRPU|nr:DNA-directed RNA polymerase III subunit RPC9 [Strongylocentrotus purpuratus]
MEVVKESAAMLSNYEVHALLKELQAGSSQRGKKSISKKKQNLATISYETIKYLENTPCGLQTPEVVEKFLQALAPYNLTKSEKLQLLNHRPSTSVEIMAMVEECEERLSEDQMESLIKVITSMLPGEQEEEGAEGEEGEEG